MNVLKREKQRSILAHLVEGCSIRSVERLTGVHRDTICRLLLRVGDHCQAILDEHIQGVDCLSVQCDEIWCYVFKKQRLMGPSDPPEWGDTYTHTALARESKLFVTHLVGKRSEEDTHRFIADLAHRVRGEVDIFTDGWGPYRAAIPRHFGARAHFTQVVKAYGKNGAQDSRRYSPPSVVGVSHQWVQGFPDANLVSTSHVERSNLTIRMASRRFTRLTNAFSKSLCHLTAAVALYMAWYNFVRVHGTIKTTPALAAGIVYDRWSIDDLLPGGSN